MSRVMVFYNENKGYIISSYAKARKQGYLVVINPVITAEADASKEELINKIEMAFEVSKNNPEIDFNIENRYCYWELKGVKTFREFCRKFAAVEINEVEGEIRLYKQQGNSNATFTPSKAQGDRIIIDANTDFHSIAEMALKLLYKGTDDAVIDTESFATLGKRIVRFKVPSDNLDDCGDGGTDAYKLYRESNSDNYIAFLIDNGYEDLNETDIRSVLERQFGAFQVFSFTEDSSQKLIIKAQNERCLIESTIFIMDDEYLELQLYVNRANDNGVITPEYHNLVESVSIEIPD